MALVLLKTSLRSKQTSATLEMSGKESWSGFSNSTGTAVNRRQEARQGVPHPRTSPELGNLDKGCVSLTNGCRGPGGDGVTG